MAFEIPAWVRQTWIVVAVDHDRGGEETILHVLHKAEEQLAREVRDSLACLCGCRRLRFDVRLERGDGLLMFGSRGVSRENLNCFKSAARAAKESPDPRIREIARAAEHFENDARCNRQLADAAGEAGDGATAATPAETLDGFEPANTLWHDHGIARSRLSEKAREGKVRTKPAPQGTLDSQGRKVRKLYNRADARKYCSPQRVTGKTRQKLRRPNP